MLFSVLSLAQANSANGVFSKELTKEISVLYASPKEIIDKYEGILNQEAYDASHSLEKFEIYYLLNQAYYSVILPEKALEYAIKANNEIDKTKHEWFYYINLVELSLAYELKGDASKAQAYALQAIEWSTSKNDFPLLQKALLAQGLNQLTLGEYNTALGHFTRAYEIGQQYENTKAPGHVAYYIALSHEYARENKRAALYFEQAAQYYKANNQLINYSDALYGLARAYKFIGEIDKAIELFAESMNLSIELDDQQGQAYTYKEISGLYLQKNDLQQAHFSLVKALQLFETSNNVYMLSEVNKQLSELAKNNRSIHHAIKLSEIAISYASNDSLKPHLISLLFLQSDLYADLGEFERAFKLHKKAHDEESAYEEKQKLAEYDRLSAELELDKEKNENRILEKQNTKVSNQLAMSKQVMLALIILLSLFVFASLLATIMYVKSAKTQSKLTELANSDPLTKLSNRRFAFETLSQQIKLSKRENFELSIALVDLDHFKKINDKYGHPTGDKILIAFSELAKNMFRSTDIIARIGGEEFLFIFPYTNEIKAQDLIINFCDKLKYNEGVTSVIDEALTCSVGITNAQDSENELDAISVADKAMYRAKSVGRDAIVIDLFENKQA